MSGMSSLNTASLTGSAKRGGTLFSASRHFLDSEAVGHLVGNPVLTAFGFLVSDRRR